MKNKLLLLCILSAILVKSSYAQINLVSFSTGYSNPVDIINCGDNRMFIIEQRGTIQICDTSGVKNTQFFLDIRSRVKFIGGGDERGLLGLAFPADFLSSGYFYVDYVALSDGHTHISRFHVNSATPDSADPASEELLLSIYQPYVNHKGGHIAFGADSYLYIGMGDGGSGGDPGNRAQNPDSLLGKILRIAVDAPTPGYTIPPGNPFAGNPAAGRGEVYCMGMRNPWKWSFDRMTHELLIGDVGQDTVEEVDFQPLNYTGVRNCGWHCYEGNQVFTLASGGCQPYTSYIDPVHTYRHNPGGYCAISGGYRYRGAKFQELYAKYFYTDYCNSQMQYLESDGSGGFINTNLGVLNSSSAIVAFGEDRWGELYCTSVNTGIVYHIVSADCTPVATINAGKDSITDCGNGQVLLHVPEGNGYSYLWTHNGDSVSTSASFTASQAGNYIVNVVNQSCTNSDSVFVDFISPLNVTITGLDTFYCNYNSPVALSSNYPGGVFIGPGISDTTFSPSVAGAGNYSIIYLYTDPTGCSYFHSQNVRVDACLNVPENVWTKTVGIFPNPTRNDFSIHAYSSVEKKLKVEIFDIAGKTLFNEVYVFGTGENSITINKQLASGIYTIKFSDDLSSSSVKLIRQ